MCLRTFVRSVFYTALCAWAVVASLCADELKLADAWDATTLDVLGEQRSFAGVWRYVPWESLTSLPDFKDAQPVQVPGGGLPGAYCTKFEIGDVPAQQRVILHFGAVAFRCTVWVNGKEVGGHAGGMTPFELDITDEVHSGTNELAVLVLGNKGRALSSEAASATKIAFNERGQALASGGDKTVLGGGMFPGEGIRQGVDMRVVPLLRVADATLVTSFRKKQLSASIIIVNETLKDQSVSIQLDVLPYDIESKAIGDTPVWTQSAKAVLKQGANAMKVEQSWGDPKLWMPGDPHLYVARIRLVDDSQKLLNERNIRFGFREVWLDGRKIIVNGKPFRAFVHGDLAAEAPPEVIRAMFEQLMKAGINTVRPHTRPPVPSHTQIADEMGMAIIGESELTFNSNYAYEEPIFWANFERLWRERIGRDKNHPSILIWSLANEVIICSPGESVGQHFYDAFLKLREIDPTRPFMQEGDGDLRDMRPEAKGFPIDIINLHPYDISPKKNPLWASEFPPVAWALESVTKPQDIPATNKFGTEMPDCTRPWFMGEFGLAQMTYPDLFSFWTGPEAYRDLFGNAPDLIRAVGEVAIMQLQAFRDMDMAGMDPWDMPDKLALEPYLQRAFEPITTFTRDTYAHWTGGELASRRLVTLNDSFETKSLKLMITLKQGEKEISHQEESFTLAPGARQDTSWEFLMPKVSERTAISFIVRLVDDQDKRVSGFQQDWLVYPEVFPVQEWRAGQIWLCGSQLGNIAEWLGTLMRPLTELSSAESLRPAVVILDGATAASLDGKVRDSLDRYVDTGGVLMIVGADKAFTGSESLESNKDSDSTRLFLLRQSPLTAGTTAQDWEFWRPDHFVSRGNYTMSFDPIFEFPLVGGGRNGPMYVPLAILKKGKGASIATRLQLDQAVAQEPVARIFLNNLVLYAKALRDTPTSLDPTLVILCPAEERGNWKEAMERARIPFKFDEGEPLVPKQQIVFLSGKTTLSPAQVDQLTKFTKEGGTLWVHRLTPQTPYLDQVSQWLGGPLNLRPPTMWLQQMELVSPSSPSPLLDGVNDFMTCWATFGWTNGNSSSVRTTPIVDYTFADTGSHGVALLKEPVWIGKWNFKPGGYLLGQAILHEVGKHMRNENPGLGLAVYPLGAGRIFLDQLRWDDVMQDAASESKEKARYLAGTLWKNLKRNP